jgi:hypothetical protein
MIMKLLLEQAAKKNPINTAQLKAGTINSIQSAALK